MKNPFRLNNIVVQILKTIVCARKELRQLGESIKRTV